MRGGIRSGVNVVKTKGDGMEMLARLDCGQVLTHRLILPACLIVFPVRILRTVGCFDLLGMTSVAAASSAFSVSDPLQRFEDEPECEDGCGRCVSEMEKTVVLTKESERLDWARIAYHLQDGRGVLNMSEMESLGVRVEGVGKVGWGGIRGR
jgi:hypothetical protein